MYPSNLEIVWRLLLFMPVFSRWHLAMCCICSYELATSILVTCWCPGLTHFAGWHLAVLICWEPCCSLIVCVDVQSRQCPGDVDKFFEWGTILESSCSIPYGGCFYPWTIVLVGPKILRMIFLVWICLVPDRCDHCSLGNLPILVWVHGSRFVLRYSGVAV